MAATHPGVEHREVRRSAGRHAFLRTQSLGGCRRRRVPVGHEPGGDWTRAALTTGASIGTGLAVAGLVAAGVVSAPAVVVVVGGAALAAGVAWGVGEIYDHWDDIENWTGDRVDDVTGLASDAWDGATEAAGDTWDGAKDLAGDAWDSATPW